MLRYFIRINLLVLYVHKWFEGSLLERKEAIALLGELGANQLITPNFVILELKSHDKYQLKIRGNYNFKEIGIFLKNKFSLEEINNYLVIFKP